jgi:cell division transport system ATP-binding protein
MEEANLWDSVEAEQGKLGTALLELCAFQYQQWIHRSMTKAPNTTDSLSNDAIIRLFHVQKRYGGRSALQDITLDIYKNEFLFITGPSGAGKTTLLKLLYLHETATEGQILVDGMNLARIKRQRIPLLRRKFGIIFQDYKLIPTKTVYENVALVLEAAGRKTRMIPKKVKSVLRIVGMEDLMNALPPSLSGGEQQRVAVARAVVGDPKIILADEPTGSLDEEAAAVIMAYLDTFHARGGTMIIATHDKELIKKSDARVVQLRQGNVYASAPAHPQSIQP